MENLKSLFPFRFEDNGRVFCEGENDVLEFYKEEPLRADTRLQVIRFEKTKDKDKDKCKDILCINVLFAKVLYPPVVEIRPTNITVNSTDQVIIINTRC